MIHNTSDIQEWVTYFSDIGLSDEVIVEYNSYISILSGNNAPVIFELEHLSKLLGVKRDILATIINSPSHFYREFRIPKRKGGFRTISAPYPSLLHCQNWIYKEILIKHSSHQAAHGFVPKRSIFTNAAKHLNKKCLLKMDLEDFFPSVPISWVIKWFLNLGYSNQVAFYLASICCLNGGLSQGAVTSPYLSNLLLRGLDSRLSLVSRKYDLVFTRYADDLCFSGNYISSNFITVITSIVEDFGLKVNEGKTLLHTKPGKRIVTGLSVSGSKIKLPREYKRALRQEVFIIKKYGLISHLSKMKIKNPNYLDSLLGKLAFWQQAEPRNTFTRDAIKFLKSLRPD